MENCKAFYFCHCIKFVEKKIHFFVNDTDKSIIFVDKR